MPTRERFGSVSFSSTNRLPKISPPVSRANLGTVPPGCGRRAANPALTGSELLNEAFDPSETFTPAEDRKGAWSQRATDTALPRRRGDRIELLAAVHDPEFRRIVSQWRDRLADLEGVGEPHERV